MSNPILKIGDQGKAVTQVEVELAARGFYKGPIDEYFGPQLDLAVREFQLSKGLLWNGVVTEQTWTFLNIKPGDPPKPDSTMPWYEWALSKQGEKEIPGSRSDNAFIRDLFKNHTTYGDTHDETPWCAAFVCGALEKTGWKSTHNAGAVSFKNFGKKSELIPGAIVVFQWASGSRHVAFCHKIIDANYAAFIGGNQSNMVNISNYARKYIEAVRFPVLKLT